jgi:hypothetical protein
VVRKACSQPLTEVQDIEYRQAILRDCLYNPEIFREFYKIVVDCLLMEKEKLHYGIFGRYPSRHSSSVHFVHPFSAGQFT